MLYLSNDLQEKGFSLFLDPDLRTEISAATDMPLVSGESVEFYIGLRHEKTNHQRLGRIIALEENYRSLMFDITKEFDGEFFRRYDEVESMEVETTFDALGFLKNILLNFDNMPLYTVLEFLSRDHIADIAKLNCTWCEWSKIVVFTGLCPIIDEPGTTVWSPSGFWGEDDWPAPGYYNFYTDFFVESGSDRIPLFDQYRNHSNVKDKIKYNFSKNGFTYKHINYNYINDIRPEVIDLLNIRWQYGSYDIQAGEFRQTTEHIMSRFQQWYNAPTQLMVSGHENDCDYLVEGFGLFKADWPTVLHHTKLGKVSTWQEFIRDEHILVSLLGPASSQSCTWEYGTTTDNPENKGPIFPENGFMVVRSNIFSGYEIDYILSDEYRIKCEDMTPERKEFNYVKAFISINSTNGNIGGKKLFDAGTGTEHRYFMPFSEFLITQGWDIDEFMDRYSDLVEDTVLKLEDAVIEKSTLIQPSMFSEFNSKYEKSPFDGIQYYVPIPFTMNSLSDDGEVNVSRRVVVEDINGNTSTSFVTTDTLPYGTFVASIDKDQYVSSVEVVNSLRIFISNFMKTRVKITFKENLIATDNLRIRILASDSTFIQKRNFNYES